jgi:hypothetical protein
VTARTWWQAVSLVLGFALVGSNVYWLLRLLDGASLAKAREQQQYETCHALRQCIELMPRIAKAKPKADIVASAGQRLDAEPFEKDGLLWTGLLGFAFDSKGDVTKVAPVWEPFQCEE